MSGGRGPHLLAILARKTLPCRIGQRLRGDPREQRRAGCELWNPDVVIVAAGKFRTWHSAGGTAHGAEAKAFISMARCSQANHPQRHAQRPAAHWIAPTS